MTRPHAGAEHGRTRGRHRFGSLMVLVVVSTAFLVTRTQPAHALSPCTVDDINCPAGVPDQYTVPFGQKLVVDAAHGLLANDHGPAGTKIELTNDCFDTTSFWTDATFNVKADGSFTYTPAAVPPDYPFSGIDTLDYCIISPNGLDDQGIEVDIAVIPTVRNDSYGTRVNTPLTVTATLDDATGRVTGGYVANDSGIDPDSALADLPPDNTSAQGGTVDDQFDGAFVYTPPPNFQGVDTFQYTAQDWDGDWVDGPYDPFVGQTLPLRGTVTIYVDGTPPTAAMTAPGPVTLSTTVTAAWSGSDPGGTGVATYDVQYNTAPWNGTFRGWTPWKTGTTATSAPLAGTYGRTSCFRVRSKDRAGNYSAWTAPRCTSVPVRARSLKYTSLWKRVPNGVYFSGEAETTVYHAQTASLAGVQARQLWLVATKCPTCGTVRFRWNNVIIADVNLASPTAVHHVVIPIRVFTTPQLGTLSLAVTSLNGKGVIIEGIAALRA